MSRYCSNYHEVQENSWFLCYGKSNQITSAVPSDHVKLSLVYRTDWSGSFSLCTAVSSIQLAKGGRKSATRHLDIAVLTVFASSREGQIKTNEPKQMPQNHRKGWKRPLRLSPTIYPALPSPTLNHVPKQHSYTVLGTLSACYGIISRTAKSEKTNAGTELRVPKTGRTTYFHFLSIQDHSQQYSS